MASRHQDLGAQKRLSSLEQVCQCVEVLGWELDHRLRETEDSQSRACKLPLV